MAKKAAYGSALAVQYAQTGSYTAIASVGDFTGPEISVETIDVTTHDSADHFNEFLAGMADGGEVSFDLVFNSAAAAHETLYNAVAARLLHNFQVQLPGFTNTAGGGYFQFAGLFTKAGASFPVKDKIGMGMSIKVSGKPVFTKFV
ncbi:MAG: phage tail tube protein [Verrucomicrobiota bacterium]